MIDAQFQSSENRSFQVFLVFDPKIFYLISSGFDCTNLLNGETFFEWGKFFDLISRDFSDNWNNTISERPVPIEGEGELRGPGIYTACRLASAARRPGSGGPRGAPGPREGAEGPRGGAPSPGALALRVASTAKNVWDHAVYTV